MSILQFSEHFQLIFDNTNVKNDKQIKQKLENAITANFSGLSNFFLILLRKPTLASKISPTNRNSSAFLLHTSKTFYNVELFSIFFTNFFGSKQCCWNNQLFCLPAVKKILRILCVWTLKMLYTNKRILT